MNRWISNNLHPAQKYTGQRFSHPIPPHAGAATDGAKGKGARGGVGVNPSWVYFHIGTHGCISILGIGYCI